MINLQLREEIAEVNPDAIVFDNPSFDNSIIGTTTDGAVIYDLRKMIEEFAGENQCDESDALDFIEYNTLRAIPYFGDAGTKPIILDDNGVRMYIEDEQT